MFVIAFDRHVSFIEIRVCLHCLSLYALILWHCRVARVRGAAMKVGLVGAVVLLLAGSAVAQQGDKVIPRSTITLGTATPGGGFPLYGNAFAEVMNEADPALS